MSLGDDPGWRILGTGQNYFSLRGGVDWSHWCEKGKGKVENSRGECWWGRT